ncbi:crotonobetainyl-CoA:carnitine CoA-transferase CaiB-like acyl-CoA transferase [Bradyrhizobium elkanii]|nr:crotonobetainyl-CoA:carnitine CoA-transferase CaiB-like acyl-CoA transferase [Bradyrhizobium elkanii]
MTKAEGSMSRRKLSAQDGALTGYTVLDLSQVRAGPTSAKQFADFGARVIKVEPPETAGRPELYVGPRNGADMANLHRNKTSMTLDLKAPQGREVLMALVRKADVVLENFRPDVKVRLGFDYESLAAVNPRIVLVSISGFGQEGPYRARPGFDQILQGMCGLMSTTGAPDGPPMRAGAAVVDVISGVYAALGAMTALLERQTSGKGQWVQISLLHSGFGLMDFQAARYLHDGTVPGRNGNDHPTSMPTSAYATKDGYINIGAGGDKMWRALCRAVGNPDVATDPDFLTDPDRVRNRAKLNRFLGGCFRERTTAEWLQALVDMDVPAGPIYSMDQAFSDPQVVAAGVVAEVPGPDGETRRILNQVVQLSRTPARIEHLLEPKGASTDRILAEIGYERADIARLREEGVV